MFCPQCGAEISYDHEPHACKEAEMVLPFSVTENTTETLKNKPPFAQFSQSRQRQLSLARLFKAGRR